MDLDELAQARLMALLVVMAAVAIWSGGVASGRRRQARFAALAQSFGSEVVREGEFLSRFPVEVGGQAFDVRYQYIGKGGGGGGWTAGWYVVTEVPLQGVSELHSAEIRARAGRPRVIDARGSDFERNFTVRDAGFPLRDGWLNDPVRGAIAHFYALELTLDPLAIEEGRLIHRAHLPLRRLDSAILRELLTRQVAVAAALERTL
jgi:hypothetical protein